MIVGSSWFSEKKHYINKEIKCKKIIIAVFAAMWACAAMGTTHTSTNQGTHSGMVLAAKQSTKASREAKRKTMARTRKNTAASTRDGDAEVLAQVLGSDNKNPLWGKPRQ